MTKETVRSADGRSYEIEYEGYLSPEQRSQVLNQIGCSTCGGNRQLSGNISTLATCPTTAKVVGQTLTLSSTPTSGTAPYTVVFKKGVTTLVTYTLVPEATVKTTTYPIVAADIGTQTFTVTVTDACPTGAKTTTDQCNVTVNAAACAALTCTLTGCPAAAITAGTAVSLTLIPSGGVSPYTYSWTDNGVPQASTTSIFSSSALTAGTHTIVGTVGDSCTNTGPQYCYKTCIITVNPACGTPITAFVVS